MTIDLAKILLPAFTTFMGGGMVQVFAIMVRRRAELRNLDASSDMTMMTGATAFMDRMQKSDESRQVEITDLKTELSRMRRERDADNKDYGLQLERANTENRRLAGMIAELQTDLDIAHRQIIELRGRLA